jgi:hypothetical protein
MALMCTNRRLRIGRVGGPRQRFGRQGSPVIHAVLSGKRRRRMGRATPHRCAVPQPKTGTLLAATECQLREGWPCSASIRRQDGAVHQQNYPSSGRLVPTLSCAASHVGRARVTASTHATATFNFLHLPPSPTTARKGVAVHLVVVASAVIRPRVVSLARCG